MTERMTDEQLGTTEYAKAARRLILKALTEGDGVMLRDIKILMDQCSTLEDELERRVKGVSK